MSDLVGPGSRYTDEDRRRAAALYVTKGTLAAVHRETGIPDSTLSEWRKSEWWDNVIGEVRSQKEEEWRADFAEIIELANRETKDRLRNGETVHTKDGLKKIPVKAKDAATIGAILYDKLRLSLNLPTSITDNSGTKKSMDALAEQFRQLSQSFQEKRVKDARAIPGEVNETDDGD